MLPSAYQLPAAAIFLVGGVVSRDPSRELTATVDVLPPFAGG